MIVVQQMLVIVLVYRYHSIVMQNSMSIFVSIYHFLLHDVLVVQLVVTNSYHPEVEMNWNYYLLREIG